MRGWKPPARHSNHDTASPLIAQGSTLRVSTLCSRLASSSRRVPSRASTSFPHHFMDTAPTFQEPDMHRSGRVSDGPVWNIDGEEFQLDYENHVLYCIADHSRQFCFATEQLMNEFWTMLPSKGPNTKRPPAWLNGGK